jgi:hypothetical protein
MGAWRDPRPSRDWSAPTASGAASARGPPKFTVTWTVDAPGKPDHGRRMQMSGCSISALTLDDAGRGEPVDNPITFDAENWAIL